VAFQFAAPLADLPADRGLRVKLDGIDVGLFRAGDEVHAMENICPHAGAPLHVGPVQDGIVTCPAHGWAYNVRTGFNADNADGFPIPCFAVKIEGDDIWVDIENPINLRRR
jgi:3-phenylpropionate/trans-cinnamate dioxygenase ferredoxin subunit